MSWQGRLPNEGAVPAGLARPVPQLGGAVRHRAFLAPVGSRPRAGGCCVPSPGSASYTSPQGLSQGRISRCASAACCLPPTRRPRAGTGAGTAKGAGLQVCLRHGHRNTAGSGRLAQPEKTVRTTRAPPCCIAHRCAACPSTSSLQSPHAPAPYMRNVVAGTSTKRGCSSCRTGSASAAAWRSCAPPRLPCAGSHLLCACLAGPGRHRGTCQDTAEPLTDRCVRTATATAAGGPAGLRPTRTSPRCLRRPTGRT
jgi:hypothetical protein